MEIVFAETLRNTDFVPTVADTDVYSIQVRKPNGEDYYGLLLVYVDYVLCCSQHPLVIMDALYFKYDMKDVSEVPPKIYLGNEIKNYQVRSGKYHWGISSTQYVKNAINTV